MLHLAAVNNLLAAMLPVAEVAKELGVCTATVHRLRERGDLPHVRVIHIDSRPAEGPGGLRCRDRNAGRVERPSAPLQCTAGRLGRAALANRRRGREWHGESTPIFAQAGRP